MGRARSGRLAMLHRKYWYRSLVALIGPLTVLFTVQLAPSRAGGMPSGSPSAMPVPLLESATTWGSVPIDSLPALAVVERGAARVAASPQLPGDFNNDGI